MNRLFYIQLITSFIVGGVFIAFLTFIAEKVDARVSGIILALPSTAALGFFFLGWSLSPEVVANIIPSSFIPLGLSVIFVAVYIYLADFIAGAINSKTLQIIFCTFISLLFWFAFAVPVILYKINNLIVGIIGYGILITITHWLLHQKNFNKPVSKKYSYKQKLGRSVFAGFMIALVVFLGKTLGPIWGSVFAVFPAAFLSSLMILHKYYNPENLFSTFQKIALGSITLLGYLLLVMLLFPLTGFAIGTVIAYAGSLIISFLLSKITFDKRRLQTSVYE
jgi:Protein of unknown function (DUF3147)